MNDAGKPPAVPRRYALLPSKPNTSTITKPGTVAASVETSTALAAIKERAAGDEDPSRRPIVPRGESPREHALAIAEHALGVISYDAAHGEPADPLELLRWQKVLQAAGGGGGDTYSDLEGLSDRELAQIEAVLTRDRPTEPPPAWAKPLENVRAVGDEPSPIMGLILRLVAAQCVPEFTEGGVFPGPLPAVAITEIEALLLRHSTSYRWHTAQASRRRP